MAGLLQFAPAFRATRGFDPFRAPLFDLVDRLADGRTDGVNIARTGEDTFRIELAVPGFAENEIEITVDNRVLTVKGTKPAEAAEGGVTYLSRGFAPASFERRFTLAEHVEVAAADLAAGVLTVSLIRKLPEERQPKRIAIGAAGNA